MDLTTIGGALAAIGTIAAGAWAWFERARRAKAETSADVATSDAQRTVADSQQTVYKMLTERLHALEQDVQSLRNELAAERAHSRKLEIHIWKLEGLMRKANLEPPIFDTQAQ